MVEAVCSSIKDPYEVNSDKDMLSRIEAFNEKIEKEKESKGESWDWREDWVLLGSDVVSLFPSLSAEQTSKIVRGQVSKSDMKWENIDDKWLRLYVHLNRDNCSGIKEISHLLPYKKVGRRGV